MADSVSSLGYIGKSETKRFVKADKVECKSLVLSDQAIFRALDESTGATLVSSGPLTRVLFPTENVKKGDIKYNNSTGIVTIGSSGIYFISAMVYFMYFAGGQRTVLIARVGSETTNPFVEESQDGTSDGFPTVLSVSDVVSLNAGDQIAVYASQNAVGVMAVNDLGPGRITVARLF